MEDHNGLVKLIDEKQQAILNQEKLIENYEKDIKAHNNLLEQAHNDKQALSRAIQQNKELKQQLAELQDAYIHVTQQNLDLTTRLQSEEFKLSQLNKPQVVEQAGPTETSEWGDEDDVLDNTNTNVNEEKQPSLIESVKVNFKQKLLNY